jgi:hypothetical protein
MNHLKDAHFGNDSLGYSDDNNDGKEIPKFATELVVQRQVPAPTRPVIPS